MSIAAVEPRPSGALEPLVVHKFGGSSLANADCFRQVATVLRSEAGTRQVVVASAMRGVTDALLALMERAQARDAGWRSALQDLRDRHGDAARSLLLDGTNRDAHLAWLDAQTGVAREILGAVAHLRAGDGAALAYVQGLGELWSSRLLADHLRAAGREVAWLDAREVLCVHFGALGAVVDWDASARRLADWRAANPTRHVVATGFIARDAHGRACVLGRNGSDFSAAIFARLFGAARLTLWGDTDGVLSADPRLVPEAVTLPELSYQEACELAYFGARVIHPQTMAPVIARALPVTIRNTFAPEHAGTRIDASVARSTTPVRGLSIASDMALVNLEGAGMIGVPGTAERAFGAMADAGVSITMISQGSSEHSICCVVRAEHADAAAAALRRAFAAELAHGEMAGVTVHGDIAVLAAVGDGMSGRPGVAARLFGALSHCGISVRAIAQGASERNISVALAAADAARALRAAHAAFWLSPQTLSVGVLGTGKVGTALLQQLTSVAPRLRADGRLDLRVHGIANSRRMHLDVHGRDPGDWSAALAAGEPLDLGRFTDAVQPAYLPHALIIDCTASATLTTQYVGWLRRGIHVVTPNKQAGAGDLATWHAIRRAGSDGAQLRYEATVGAGLPIIQTLRDLIDTGDAILSIDGILSGTLAWLFNRFDGTQPFSKLLREAHARGYTEPDPRDDLSGIDVARKLVILAREAGRDLSLEDVQVENLIPASLAAVPRADFLAQAEALDAGLAQRQAHAAASGCVLRHVAQLDDTGARVALRELPREHAFAHLRLTDNIVQFTTRRYHENPLIVQGPGAGPEVTAAGVFADILRIAAQLGAPA